MITGAESKHIFIMASNVTTRRRALQMFMSGLVKKVDIAKAAKVSRQTLDKWIKEGGPESNGYPWQEFKEMNDDLAVAEARTERLERDVLDQDKWVSDTLQDIMYIVDAAMAKILIGAVAVSPKEMVDLMKLYKEIGGDIKQKQLFMQSFVKDVLESIIGVVDAEAYERIKIALVNIEKTRNQELLGVQD